MGLKIFCHPFFSTALSVSLRNHAICNICNHSSSQNRPGLNQFAGLQLAGPSSLDKIQFGGQRGSVVDHLGPNDVRFVRNAGPLHRA